MLPDVQSTLILNEKLKAFDSFYLMSVVSMSEEVMPQGICVYPVVVSLHNWL